MTATRACLFVTLLSLSIHGGAQSASPSAAAKRRSSSPPTTPSGALRLRTGAIKANIIDGRLVLTGVNGGFGGGQIRIDSHIDPSRPEAPQRAQAEMRGVDVGELLRAAKMPVEGVTGRATGRADLNWRGAEANRVLSTLDGNVSLEIGKGDVTNPRWVAQLARLARMPELEKIEFSSGRIDAQFRQGQMVLRSGHLSSSMFQLTARGTVDLVGEKMQLGLSMSVSRQLAEKSGLLQLNRALSLFGSRLVSADREGPYVHLPELSLKGTFDRPEFEVLLSSKDSASETVAKAAAEDNR